MIRLGILTFSDGRKSVHEEMLPMNKKLLDELVKRLQETGEVEPVLGEEIIYTPEQAKREAERLAALDVHGTILNFSIWCFPHLGTIAARYGKAPFLMLSNVNPKAPGLIAMLATAGCLDQLGISHTRLWGDINKPEIMEKIIKFARASKVVSSLRGQKCGIFGGRSMGMYIGTVDTAQWQNVFGVDLEHIDQSEIIRIAKEIPQERVDNAMSWLEKNIGSIKYDHLLTREKLETQVRSYLATKKIIEENKIDFMAIKCQPELSNNYVTQCLTQAFINDPYDMEGPKDPVACGCEGDLDGVLTMQILKLLTDQPVLFYDLRHYDPDEDIFVFSNCGAMSTYYAGCSASPRENLAKVTFYPQTPFYYPAGGAAVQFMCAPGEVTFARLARKTESIG